MNKNMNKAAARKQAIKETLIGVAFAAVGGIATAVSYSTAASKSGGGTYTIYTGIIALGVIYAIKGLYGIIFPLGLGKKKQNPSDNTSQKTAESTAEVKVIDDEDQA